MYLARVLEWVFTIENPSFSIVMMMMVVMGVGALGSNSDELEGAGGIVMSATSVTKLLTVLNFATIIAIDTKSLERVIDRGNRSRG